MSQLLAYGGKARQFQVLVDLKKLNAFKVTLADVIAAVKGANTDALGRFLITVDSERLIRGIGRVESLDDLQQAVITGIGDVATIKIGAAIKHGDGSFNGQPAVILLINRQPLADTPTVTRAIEKAMGEIGAGLPKDVKLTQKFRQEEYIGESIDNVRSSLVEGSVIIALILIPFLMN